MGSYEKFVELGSEEFPEIYALLKADLLEDIDACAKFVHSVGNMICLDSFVKNPAYSRKFFLLATMYKNLIMVVEYMCIDQDAIEDAKEIEGV